MKVSTVRHEYVPNEIDIDRPEFSICPNCAVEIIKLDDGCGVCGWKSHEKLLGGDRKNPRKSSSTKDNKLTIPCLIKQPKQPELKGVIKKDLGDRFIVYVPDSDSTVTVSKLLVYPDFSQSVGQIDKNPSKNFSKSKKLRARRRKGSGSGSIYERTVIRNNKEYQQSYYHYKLNGKKGTFYIPQRLLGLIKEAESSKLPVIEVLKLLGEKPISPSKSSDTLTNKQERVNDEAVELREINPSNGKSPSKSCQRSAQETSNLLGDKKINPSNNSITTADEQITVDDEVIETRIISPSNNLSPSKKRQRSRGKGSGSVHYRTIKKKNREYKQAYYHYEFWQKGDRVVKSSEYIPKKMETKIIGMNNEKVPVEEILKVLRDRSKRKK